MSECELRRRVRDAGIACDDDECVFWAHLGADGEPQCAIQYFRMLDGPGLELAEWLLSLKENHEIEAALGVRRIGSAWVRSAE